MLLACDNAMCEAPWVGAGGLVVWAISDGGPVPGLFTDRLLVACNAECLQRALAGRAGRRWSPPMAVGAWLDALREAVTLDPGECPIGQFASAF